MNIDICVIGLGYMGLPMASILATSGFKVIGVDKNREKVTSINSAICPFDETGMEPLINKAVKECGLIATVEIPKAPAYVVSVPTPEKNHKCDLTYVLAACNDLAKVVENGSLIIIESTIKPNTCRDHVAPVFEKAEKKVLISHCPERAIPGNTIHELINNDRIIGGLTKEATEKTHAIYKKFIKGNIHLTDATTAECCKLMENTFRDVNIALANEFAEVLGDFGVNPWEAIRLANKHPRVNILSPGPGVGGHCIAIDPWFLTEDSEKAILIRTAREINDNRPKVIVDQIEKLAGKSLKKVGILGVAYKKDVDDSRETPATHIIELLLEKGYEVKCTDPFVKDDFTFPLENLKGVMEWSDLLVLVTDHSQYKGLSIDKPFLDTRNLLQKSMS